MVHELDMRKKPTGPLAKYLAETGLKGADFATLIGVTPTAIYRYCQGRIPDPSMMRAIALATGNKVTPNDWLGINVRQQDAA